MDCLPSFTDGSEFRYFEDALLGALLLEPKHLDALDDILSGNEFIDAQNGIIFRAMREMHATNQPIDVITVAIFIDNRGLSITPGSILPMLGNVAHNSPSPGNAIYYAKGLAARAKAKGASNELAQLSSELSILSAEMALHPKADVKARMDKVESRLIEIKSVQEERNTFRHVKDVTCDTVEDIERSFENDGAPTGLLTGFSKLDELLGGLQGGDLIIVAGRPSMGKTAFAVNIGENMASNGDVGAVVSMEMPGKQLTARMCSSLGRIRSDDLRRGRLDEEGFSRLGLAISKLEAMRLYIDDRSVACLADIRGICRKVVAKEGKISFLIIDYLQLMNELVRGRGGDNRTEEISTISRGLKSIAKEFGIPVIALSQLNRSLEKRQDKRPMMSDLRESGAIEQDADVIMFVYRDEVYNPDSAETGKAEIIIGKQRNGPIGMVVVNFEKEYSKFSNFAAGGY